MIHVIASIHVPADKVSRLAEIYNDFVPLVLLEEGCREYAPTVDYPTDVARQVRDDAIVTVIEKWTDIEAFKAHINMPHSVQFRKDIEGIVDQVSIKILKGL